MASLPACELTPGWPGPGAGHHHGAGYHHGAGSDGRPRGRADHRGLRWPGRCGGCGCGGRAVAVPRLRWPGRPPGVAVARARARLTAGPPEPVTVPLGPAAA